MEELVVLERFGACDFLDCGVDGFLDHGGGSGEGFGECFHVDRHVVGDPMRDVRRKQVVDSESNRDPRRKTMNEG